MKKLNLIFLMPGPIFFPELPDFRDRYLLLSEFCEGEVYSWTCSRKETVLSINGFVYKGMPALKEGILTKLRLAFFFIKKATSYNKLKKVDAIVCYDPMFTGFIGFILRCMLGCKLIVEVNSFSVGGASRLFEQNIFIGGIKSFFYRFLSFFALRSADRVKLLTPASMKNLPGYLEKNKAVCFHDFVPTHYFDKDRADSKNYILFIGYPFYLKGVDILIKAFKRILEKHSDFRLVLIGHQLEERARHHEGLVGPNIEFLPGLSYEKIKDYLLECYCLVLPSRTEGMGKVLIEAMSCGKPVIGSNVGGIPWIIESDKNGLLFESENEHELVECLERLIADPDFAKKIGEKGRATIEKKFSSRRYVEHFKTMVEELVTQ